ncbi:MAG TPA: hypothetical protein VFG21_03695 [Xanthomonadaceae bacterium]|nr:hypothetical protein [Xanthomonadaceae bacterium]
MQVHIVLRDTLLEQPQRLYSAVALVIEVAQLREVDLERAVNSGVVSGQMRREKLLDLASIDVVQDYCLPGDAAAVQRLSQVLARRATSPS